MDGGIGAKITREYIRQRLRMRPKHKCGNQKFVYVNGYNIRYDIDYYRAS